MVTLYIECAVANDSSNASFVVVLLHVQESWEDEEEKKDEEKPTQKTDAPVKTKPNKALKAKLAEQEVELIDIHIIILNY